MDQGSSRAQPERAAKSQRPTESATAKALDWANARARGERLSAHELRCESCGEPSTAAVCVACIEHQLEAQNYERTCQAH